MKVLILLLSLLSIGTSLSAQVRPVQFTAKKELPVIGSTTQTVAIRVKDFTDVTSTQFTLQWPASVFEFSSVSDYGLPNLDLTHFNVALATTGKLTFSWDDVTTQGLSLNDDTVIFKINFQVRGAIPASAVLELAPAPTPTEVTRLLKPSSVMFNNENLSGCNCN